MLMHITNRRKWEKARVKGVYADKSLQTDGFIHCSYPHQATRVANALFRQQDGLVVLCIDEKAVKAEIRVEDLYHSGEAFPHIYGPLEIEAVSEVFELIRD